MLVCKTKTINNIDNNNYQFFMDNCSVSGEFINMSKCARRECPNTSSSMVKCKYCSAVYYCSTKCRGDDYEDLHSYECNNQSDIVLRNLLETPTKLAEGKFGEVKQVSHQITGVNYAIEEIPKSKISKQKLWDSLKEFIQMRKSLDHKYIVPLLAHLKDKQRNYLLFGLPLGSSLRNLIQARTFAEEQTRIIFKKICKAVKQLHDLGIPHRNIKTENIYVDSTENPVICDHTWDPDWLPKSSSTRDWDYMAPEFIEGFPIRTHVDLWNLGIVLFEMTHSLGPFEHLKNKSKKRNIMALKFEFAEIDYYAKDLITKLLVINPEERISIEEILEHPYVTGQEIEVTVGTVFYVNDKQCGILKGTITTVQLNTCVVQYKEIKKEETLSLKKIRKLLKQSKNVELKQSRKMKNLVRMPTASLNSYDTKSFSRQNTHQIDAPTSIDTEQTEPSRISIVRNAMAGSKNLQSLYHVYNDNEKPNASAVNSLYMNHPKNDESQNSSPRTKKKPPAMNLMKSKDPHLNYIENQAQSVPLTVQSLYGYIPSGDLHKKVKSTNQSLYQLNSKDIANFKNHQQKGILARRDKQSDRLFNDYIGEGITAQKDDDTPTPKQPGWFRKFFSGI